MSLLLAIGFGLLCVFIGTFLIRVIFALLEFAVYIVVPGVLGCAILRALGFV
jgi:hypothetical protein